MQNYVSSYILHILVIFEYSNPQEIELSLWQGMSGFTDIWVPLGLRFWCFLDALVPSGGAFWTLWHHM